MIDPASGQKKVDVQVNAPIVVLAAGPLQTPLLLQKSGLANSSGQVGKNFACHPTLSVTAEFPYEVRDFHGATHSLYMDRDTLPDRGGYLLLNAIQEPVAASFKAEPGTGVRANAGSKVGATAGEHAWRVLQEPPIFVCLERGHLVT